jgi:hypothetical protein
VATVTLIPTSYAASPSVAGSPISGFFGTDASAVGDTDPGICIQATGDGKTIHNSFATGQSSIISFFFTDPGVLTLPSLATINSVQIQVRHAANNVIYDGNPNPGTGGIGPLQFFSAPNNDGTYYAVVSLAGLSGSAPYTFTYQVNSSAVMAVNPQTGFAWARSELFSSGDTSLYLNGLWMFEPYTTGIGAGTFDVDQVSLVVTYTAALPQICYFNSLANHYKFSASDPGAPWVATTAPTVSTGSATSVSPAKGPTTGGTVI